MILHEDCIHAVRQSSSVARKEGRYRELRFHLKWLAGRSYFGMPAESSLYPDGKDQFFYTIRTQGDNKLRLHGKLFRCHDGEWRMSR